MSEKQLRQRQNGRTQPSTPSIAKAPTSGYDGPSVEQDPQYARMAFHLGSAGMMIYGFQSLSDIAAGQFMAPQVSRRVPSLISISVPSVQANARYLWCSRAVADITVWRYVLTTFYTGCIELHRAVTVKDAEMLM